MNIFLAIALLAVSAVSAAAADSKGDYPKPDAGSLGLRAVYYRADDGDQGTWGPGAQARWTFNNRFAVEGSFDYLRQEFPGATAHTVGAQISGLVYFLNRQVSPFLIGGGGYYAARVNATNYRRNFARFGPHLGAGLQYWINERWSADTAYRYVWVEDINTNDPAGNPRTFRRSGSHFTIAVNMHFDKTGK